MLREEVNSNLKWDLTHIFATHEDWEKSFKELGEELNKFSNYKGKLSNKDVLLDFFKFEDEFNKKSELVGLYIFLQHDKNLKDSLYIEDNAKLDIFDDKLTELTTFIMPELSNLNDEFYNQLVSDENFKIYKYKIEHILSSKKHVLSQLQEETLSVTSKYSGGFGDVFDALSADFKFDSVEVNGKSEILNEGTYSKFVYSEDRKVRTKAYNNLYKTYNQFANTLAQNYISFLKMCCSELKLRKEESAFYVCFHSEKISRELYDTLIKNVKNNINLQHDYFRLLKQKLNLTDFGFMDIYLSLSKNNNKHFSIEEQKKIVKQALIPLGKEYISTIETAFNNNWIDFCPSEVKQSGGYMLDIYGVHPYILLNDNSNYSSLSTLIHELGHAMHSYYSNLNQPYIMKDYATFIAEIASTVNEILLNKYLYNKAQTDEEKLFYLSKYIENFKSTVFRQVMFSQFEDFAIKTIENDGILSENILTAKYKELLQENFLDIVNIDENIIHEWARVPHFYSPYYVFQYATSFISSVYIANALYEDKFDMKQKYFEMLKSGGNGYPTEILAKTGVDLTKNETYTYAFNSLKDALNEAKVLIEKLNKK